MKVAGLVIGILGAIVTFFIAIGALLLGGLGSALGVEGSGVAVLLGWLTLLASIVGLWALFWRTTTPKSAGF